MGNPPSGAFPVDPQGDRIFQHQAPSLAGRRAHLLCLAGENVGQVFDLKEVTIIGRRTDVDIPVPDARVSRKHVEIGVSGEEAFLVDLGSRNGTYVNDQAVREVRLSDGDQLRLGGGTVLRFAWSPDGGDESASREGLPVSASLAELRGAQQRLVQSEKLIAVCQLGSGVAHEVINPLSAVMHNLSFVESELSRLGPKLGESREELCAALKDAREGADRIRRIVTDLQEFAWQQHDDREPLELPLVLEDSLRQLEALLSSRARVERDFRPAPRVEANAARLAQVFTYLLTNAAEAILPGDPEKNVIRVSLATDVLGRAVVEVSDSGVGMSEDVLMRIFDPFFTTKSFGKGMGLSLALAQGIVAALNGEIFVESQKGQGSLFRVVLPKYREPGRTAELRPESARAKLLLVTDLVALAGDAGDALGHTVVRARESSDAVSRILAGERFDLIFVPLAKEGMDATAFCAALQAAAEDQLRRVVFLVGDDATPAQLEFLNQRAHARLRLPLDRARLTALIPQWLRLWED